MELDVLKSHNRSVVTVCVEAYNLHAFKNMASKAPHLTNSNGQKEREATHTDCLA
jgi:hypothetical protein